jgi:hypothetical protein
MAQCREYLDNGNRCRRSTAQPNGRCRTCHGITSEWKRCTHTAARGKYCGRKHKTLEEIADHKAAAQARRNRSRSRSSRTTTSTWPSYSAPSSSYGSAQPPYGTRRPRQTSPGSRSKSSGQGGAEGGTGHRSRQPLTEAVKREAATLCSNAILGQDVLAAFESQITAYVSSEVINELMEHWDGKSCEDLAKIARGLLGLKGYLTKLLQVALNWIMEKTNIGIFPRLVACQLVAAIPLPWNAKLVAVARVLQVTGICLCFSHDRLLECRCLHDLVQFESMQAIGHLLTGAIHDWREIAERMPQPKAS